MNSTMETPGQKKMMSSRRVVEEAIDQTKANKQLSWSELLAKAGKQNAVYPAQKCDDNRTPSDSSQND